MKKLFTLMAAALMAVCVNAKEVTLVEGDFTVNGWANQPTFLSDAGTELKSAGALPGDVVRFYIDSADEGWQVQIVEGHWGPTYAHYAATALVNEETGEPVNNIVVDLSVTPYLELELTQEILDAAYTQKYWGGVFLLNGTGNVKVSKMTLKTALDWSEEAKNITFDENGVIAASEFEGLNDKAIVKFTYNVAGDISSYTNWGIGRISSNDGTTESEPTVIIASLPASALGDLTVSCFFEDIKKALVASPDGIVFSVWSFGGETAVASRVKVEAFDVVSGEGGEEATSNKIVFDATEGLKSSYDVNGFKLEYVDTDGKMAVDANSQFFGTAEAYENFTARFKTGAKSGAKSSITLTIPSAGTLKIAVRSASSSATDRNLVLTQGGTELFNKVIKENEATDYETATIEGESKKVFPIQSIEVAAGTVEVTYPTGSLNFYCFELLSATGIQQTVAPAKVVKSDAIYNLAGQKVNETYKGIVIKNGKKYIQK